MSLFLLAFFLLYGCIHFYTFMKAKAALAFGPSISVILILFMLVMILAPIIVHYAEKVGLELFARIMAHIGFVWGGLLFLFFSASVFIDLCRLVIYLGELILQRDLAAFSSRYAFFIPLFLSLCVTMYGFFEARDIRTERILIRTSKLPPEIGRLKIAQISDVHLGLMVREGRLNRILAKVKAEEPDILVSTGDLLDGQVCKLNGLEDLLKEVRPRYGKFAVTGNHEFYAGFENSLCFTEKAGFRMLRGEGTTVAGGITVVGIDDPAGKFFGLAKDISEKELLSGFGREKFLLYLKHRPLVDKGAAGLFDLQLSGHIHKGQIFPFTLVTELLYPITSGRLALPNGSLMYVSRGSGTWGPPIRFLAPPEVTIVELIHADVPG
ncbi:MAG: metallophosphoesterase [Nitrospirae bacterium]|nr:metallophosphoesterase [Nitrospirota bacterium]